MERVFIGVIFYCKRFFIVRGFFKERAFIGREVFIFYWKRGFYFLLEEVFNGEV